MGIDDYVDEVGDGVDDDASTPVGVTIVINDDGTQLQNTIPHPGSSSSGKRKRTHGSKKKPHEHFIKAVDCLNHSIKEMTVTLTIQTKQDMVNTLYREVMDLTFEGFDVHVLNVVFGYLVENEKEAKMFIARDKALRAQMVYTILTKLPKFSGMH
uniref:Uncharacterized protein n=1 Tax=Nelumbo nucifera TaxID=4432 RepID=A0A822XQ72_NELNU|nr:TPA_asm: hypothetical protein HUJ06_024053 [Nelumbo nucifera]